MVVPLMQSISGGDDCTYTLYMSPLTAGMLGLPCRPCSGPWKLKFGDYYLVLTILGVLGMVRKHLRLRPTFFDADFCSGSVWKQSWGAKSLLTASAESAGNPLNYSLTSKYEFVLWPHRISKLTLLHFLPSDGLVVVVHDVGKYRRSGP
jgi:hypothetical protein